MHIYIYNIYTVYTLYVSIHIQVLILNCALSWFTGLLRNAQKCISQCMNFVNF